MATDGIHFQVNELESSVQITIQHETTKISVELKPEDALLLSTLLQQTANCVIDRCNKE